MSGKGSAETPVLADRVKVGAFMVERTGQFSLAYLFLETAWIALALGLFRAAAINGSEAAIILIFAGIVSAGVAIYGMFRTLRTGRAWALLAAIVAGLIVPAAIG
jgi:hypothetical protein